MNTLSAFFRKIFFGCIDLLLPPSDIERMRPEEFASRVKSVAQRGNLPADIEILFPYRDSLVRRAIWELKYRGNRKIASLLSALLYERMLREARKRESSEERTKIIVIPIPSSQGRLREKGFNQVHLLVEMMQTHDTEKIFSFDISTLQKIRETKTQVSVKNKNDRLQNLRGAFAVARNKNVTGTTIFLIDDVATTGATLWEAKHILSKAGAKKVVCFAIAH
ncbi:MAG: phosphoribosyltransferase family protein [Candidatus Pacebacteria bacterium]|nr:phosphoribosyltransferase family protein [Candidatus Paceibacterota bacterium]MDD5357105.1 phosphoribosyltransferase family protein [Candidatus Paceibacterota bacterium]